MKIGFIGGTGNIGKGLALRWGKNSEHEIYIGSRNEERGEKAAEEYTEVLEESGYSNRFFGGDNKFVVEKSELLVLCIPYNSVFETIESMSTYMDDEVLISPVVPMFKSEGRFDCEDICAAVEIDEVSPDEVEVVSAFHTVPAKGLMDLEEKLDCDVVVCGDDKGSKDTVLNLVDDINGMRGLDGGDLSVSKFTEAMTPLLLNVSINNDISHPAIKFISP